ncbi:MAG: nucleotidyl transferase AbiEii/AbiGii toxin family protein [Planctomycetes bacterium]|nr:nucleotidyl transferase AbiEii/AbiGii toxin family protein [Planctomycetota bacterium]
MTKAQPKDLGASVRARLLRFARERGEDFQFILMRYANERLLFRITESRHSHRFVLKGANLFTIWTGKPHRATRDLDLLVSGNSGEAHMREIFAEILALNTVDDGVRFDLASLAVGPIRDGQEYGGIRVEVVAQVTTARVSLQIDLGFGDAITPEATMKELPALLDFPAPCLRTYPRETVVAEKIEAIVQLGMANSRMKDFYDLVIIARIFDFDGEVLVRAIRATFDRRQTPIPVELPVALTAIFAADETKKIQWSGFVRKAGVHNAGTLQEAIREIVIFLAEPLRAAASSARPPRSLWPAGGPWKAGGEQV